MTDSLLIGRDHPAALLRAAVERTTASHGGLALVTGEAGIGKTALVTGVAAEFRDELMVLFATSWESEAVPEYWLWTQVLRSLKSQLPKDEWAELPTEEPGIAAMLGQAESVKPSEFELYDAVTRLLTAASQHRPIVVVLDDLHFADPGSIDALKFASQHTWFERVLFIGTYRDVEVDAGHPLRARMLPLVAKATMVTLDGLDETGVARLIGDTVGRTPEAEVIAEITRRTGGNPFFVEQTAQLWATGQSVDATTAGMRDALERRLQQLDEPLIKMLALASVGGREFHPAVMSGASGIELHRIEAAIDAACQTRLIRPERDRFVFVHDLVREKLYAGIPEAEASKHHGCIVRALVADESLQKLMLATEIAHHAWLAGDHVDPEVAVDFLARAATESGNCLVGRAAEKYLRRAVERCGPDMVRRRVLLRLELADAVRMTRREDEARAIHDLAVMEAQDHGDPLLLVRAVVSGPHEGASQNIDLKRRIYEELTGTPPDPGLSHDDLTRQILANFMAAARERDSDDDIAYGLWATHAVMWGPGTAARRQELVEELIEVARRTGDEGTRLFATSLRWVALLEQGDPAFRDQLELFAGLAENTGTERWLGAARVDRSVIAVLQGRFEQAAELLEAAREFIGDDRVHEDWLRYLEWEARYAAGEAPEPPSSVWRTVFGSWHYEIVSGLSSLRRGDIAEARRAHDRVEAESIDHYDSWASLWLRFETELAVAEGDAEMIARLRSRLAPHEGEWLVAMWGCSIHGPISHWLGVLAAAACDRERALECFRSAAEQADRLGAVPWAKLARGAAADLTAPAPIPVAAGTGPLLRRDRSTWTLRYDGTTIHLPHTKGLADLQHLLERPGAEVSAVELLDPEAGPEVATDAALGGDDVLDDEARARYRSHLEALDDQIDAAAAFGNDARAAVLDAERAALIEQLKVATGLGGRSRRLGDNAERARKSVTNRIRNTLKKLESVHPPLAAHLRETVTTGSSCAYRPGADAPEWGF
ncbi:ATP-binding protein [Glycomyces buryatensis]|uniref:ATPase n=1 Tax=Glycomyces buryatensis TaxID=2570927 RepID=A0A4S8PVZ0_9ACTN|nr:AAA family ATPase [Glycomyces buryatensis]THV35750.1 ATPase [Glycomyces buryatensis]